jgi:hypothetical protein
MIRRISLFGSFVYLPLLHTLVEERAAPQAVHPICCSVLGEGRLDPACPSPCPSPRSAGRGDVIQRFQGGVAESEMRPS